MSNKKGYNNPDSWEEFEQPKKTINNHITINPLEDVLGFEEPEYLEVEEIEIQDNNFDEVLQLSAYNDGSLTRETDFIVAEYDKIEISNIDKKHKLTAQKFISKVTKFICSFNDVQLTQEHKDYIEEVGKLQLENLSDLLSLTEINKQMIGNIVARVNATQAEDYAIINSYNNLINQHIKLIKEVQTLYKSIPSTIKKMRAEIMTNQELENETSMSDELITEDYGDTQFNNSKQLLKNLIEKREQNKQN